MHTDLLTCLDDSRKKEPIYEYKYSENNYDDKMVKIIKDPDIKSKKTKESSEEVIANKLHRKELKNKIN